MVSDDDGWGTLVARTRERRRGRAFPKLGSFRSTMQAARPSYLEHQPVAAAAAASFSGLPQARSTYRTVVDLLFFPPKAYPFVGRPDGVNFIILGTKIMSMLTHHFRSCKNKLARISESACASDR